MKESSCFRVIFMINPSMAGCLTLPLYYPATKQESITKRSLRSSKQRAGSQGLRRRIVPPSASLEEWPSASRSAALEAVKTERPLFVIGYSFCDCGLRNSECGLKKRSEFRVSGCELRVSAPCPLTADRRPLTVDRWMLHPDSWLLIPESFFSYLCVLCALA